MPFISLLRLNISKENLEKKFPSHKLSQSTTGKTTLVTTIYKTQVFFTTRNLKTWTVFVRPQPDHVISRIVNSIKLAFQPTFWDYENDPIFAKTSLDSHVPPPDLRENNPDTM